MNTDFLHPINIFPRYICTLDFSFLFKKKKKKKHEDMFINFIHFVTVTSVPIVKINHNQSFDSKQIERRTRKFTLLVSIHSKGTLLIP